MSSVLRVLLFCSCHCLLRPNGTTATGALWIVTNWSQTLPEIFFLFVVLHSPFRNVSQDQLSHPVPHLFLCHTTLMTRTRGFSAQLVEQEPQSAPSARYTRSDVAGAAWHPWAFTPLKRDGASHIREGRRLLQPWKCTPPPPTTKAWTHPSSAVVRCCLLAQNSCQQAEQSILSHWNRIQLCLSLLCWTRPTWM